jgi:hypothetical protein
LKYSLDKQLKIIISSDKIIFENNIHVTLDKQNIDQILTKYYSGSYNDSK